MSQAKLPQPAPVDHQFVVYSAGESMRRQGAGFWSNTHGWSTLANATLFSAIEKSQFSSKLPVTVLIDSTWLSHAEAQRRFIEPESAPAFFQALARFIAEMRREDAKGQAYAMARTDTGLELAPISLTTLDSYMTGDLEMLVLDGSNSSGDSWKALFHPKQRLVHVLDENAG